MAAGFVDAVLTPPYMVGSRGKALAFVTPVLIFVTFASGVIVSLSSSLVGVTKAAGNGVVGVSMI